MLGRKGKHVAVISRRISRGWITPLAVVLSLLMGTVAWADTITNTIDSTVDPALESVTITAGGNTTVSFYVIPFTGAGDANGCNATGSDPATATLTVPVGVTATPSAITFEGCGNAAATLRSVVFTSNTPGSYDISIGSMAGGKSGSSWVLTPASFTLNVNPAAPSDTTAPTAAPTQSPAANANGWNNSDVTVSWNWTDNAGGSGIDSANCTTSSTSTGEGTLTLNATCKDNAGNTGNASYTVYVDKTPPTASAAVSPAANGNGWNNGNVTVSFSGDDGTGGSGIDFCSADVVLMGEGAGQSASGTCTDKAGNVSASATASGINIDETAPSVNLVGGPADGSSHYYGSVPAAPSCSAYDALSGIDGSCSVSGYSTAVGSHTVTATVTDKAGNSASASSTYSVLSWTLFGFFAPVDMGYMNTVKGGSTVPLKFRVFAGTELTDTAVVKSLTSAPVGCVSGMAAAAVEELAQAGSTILRYDADANQFIYNWKTPKMPGTCLRVTLTTQDGSTIVANFQLK